MLYKVFQIDASNPNSTDEMNKFIKMLRVLEVEKHFVPGSFGGHWSFCIGYIESDTQSTASSLQDKKSSKVDYKEILDEQSFVRFARLREIRRQIALEDSIPPYAIFTNEELAEISKLEELSKSALTKIRGIGEKKAEKYTERFSLMYAQMLNNEQQQQ
jgi:superfamily II DNA helicase RecQ